MYMKFNIFYVLMGMVLLSASVFAVGFSTEVVVTPSAVNDNTNVSFFKFNVDLNATTTSGADFNTNSLCWYSVTDANTDLNATWVNATKTCWVHSYHNPQNDDFNYRMVVSNGQRDTNYRTGYNHIWSDENAPTSTFGTVTTGGGKVTIPVYCKDGTTGTAPSHTLANVKEGSGCTGVWWNDNGGTWNWIPGYTAEYGPTVARNIVVTGTGNHTILWCVEDRLDNNSCQGGTGEWTKDVTVEGYPNGVCGLSNLIIFVLAAVALISFVYAGYGLVSGNIGIETVAAIGISAITFLIILFVTAMVNGIMCVV